jgi:hypothetical protein
VATEIERLRERNAELQDALSELADLMDAVRAGDYTPDSFTTQPARAVLAEILLSELAKETGYADAPRRPDVPASNTTGCGRERKETDHDRTNDPIRCLGISTGRAD